MTELITPKVTDHLPMMVRTEVAKLSPSGQGAFLEEYNRKAKGATAPYVLWFLGWHYAYLGKWGTQVLYWITAGGALAWAIVDLFRIPGMVRSYNKDVAIDVLRNQKIIAD